MFNKDKIVGYGIDLGTTNSVLTAVDEDGNTLVIPNREGKKTTPSFIKFSPRGAIVGDEAKDMAIKGDTTVVRSFKTSMGSIVNFKTSTGEVTAVEASTKVIEYIMEYGEEYTGVPVKEAVVTVPAYFNEIQRKRTIEACEKAGLKVLRVINEPTSASLAYGFNAQEEKTILVYDLGGGTFDVSILEIEEGLIDVKSTKGDTHLGGDDVDALVYSTIDEWVRKKLKYKPNNEYVNEALKNEARRVKEELSYKDEVEVDLTVISKTDSNFVPNGSLTMTKAQFEKLIAPVVKRTIDIVSRTMADGDVTADEIDEIILVGGSTRIPLIKAELEAKFGIPVRQKEINPDEIVSVGAAIQCHIIKSDAPDMVLNDVTPLNLSVGVDGGLCDILIKANTSIPAKKIKTYSISQDYQERVVFRFYQGNNVIAKENTYLGEVAFELNGKYKKEEIQLDVEFRLNVNGELLVTATNIIEDEVLEFTRTLG